MFTAHASRFSSALATIRGHDPLRFPAHSLVGVIDDPAALRSLVAALGRSGVDETQVRIIREVAQEPPGVLERLQRWIQEFGPEPALRGRYEAELNDGHAVVVVRDLQQRTEYAVRTALDAFGAHFVHHYGRFTVATLDA